MISARTITLLRDIATVAFEAAWLAVTYAALAAWINFPNVLGLGWMVLVVGVALVAGRLLQHPDPAKRAAIELWLSVTGGIASLVVQALLGMPPPDSVLFGLLCVALVGGVAVWRGLSHVDSPDTASQLAGMLEIGLPGIALPWLIGSFEPEARATFAAGAIGPTIVFVAAGLAAVGLARYESLARDTAPDTHQTRTWLAVILAVMGILLLFAIPAAFLLGVPLSEVARHVAGPAGGFIGGGGQSGLGGALDPGTGIASIQDPHAADAPLTVALGIIVLLIFAGVAWLAWSGAARLEDPQREGNAEEDQLGYELPHIGLGLPHLPRLGGRSRPRPQTATEAYLGALAEAAREPATARRPTESPAAHVRRLGPLASLRLRLLAADYELERYGRQRLSTAETRRAIERSRRWRRR